MRQKKSFEHNQIEKCKLTKEDIETTIHDYVILVECRGKEIKNIGFYKHKEFLDLIKGKTQKIEQQLLILII